MNLSPEIFLSCYEFAALGTELLISQNIPFLQKSELQLIGTYYSVLFGASYPDQGLLFGPLPVPYHHDKLLFIYGNEIKDERLTDPRVVRNGYMTPFFLLVFFPTRFDQIFSKCRVKIKTEIDEWFLARRHVKEMTLESLAALKMRLTDIIMKENVVEASKVPDALKTVLAKNLDFLNTIGHSLGRILRIGVFGTTSDILLGLSAAVSQNFNLIRAMILSADEKSVIYRFSNLCIEGGTIEADEVVDLKKTSALTNISYWKDCPKEFDGILLTIQIPSKETIIKMNIQTILKRTPDLCPISLLIRYAPDYLGDISDTLIPALISEATNRTISMIEAKGDQNVNETALINMIEKIVPSLYAKYKR